MKFLRRYSHWFIFALGVLLSAWVAYSLNRQIDRKAEALFSLRTLDLETSISRRLRSYEDILFGVAGFYQASEKVTADEFETYAVGLNMTTRYSALQTINFAQYVTADDRKKFLTNYREDSAGRGKTSQPTLPENQPEYMVLTRAYPASMAYTLGAEIFYHVGRRLKNKNVDAVLRSTDYLPNIPLSSGLPIAREGSKSPSFAIRLGIFKNGKLIGTSGIGFEIHEFFREATPPSGARWLHYRALNVGRMNGKFYPKPVEVFDSKFIGMNSFADDDKPLLKKGFGLTFGGALLNFDVTAQRESMIEYYERHLPLAVFCLGFVLFAAIAISTRKVLIDNAALDKAVNERARELQCEVNKSKSLEKEVVAIADSERHRIGRELHDDIGQQLTAITLSAAVIAEDLLEVSPRSAIKVDDMGRAIGKATESMRTLAHGLVPIGDEPSGLRNALMHMAAGVSRLKKVTCTFHDNENTDISDESVSSHLFRIAQEAVNNALKHAHATTIEIQLMRKHGKIFLGIMDNGEGFDLQANAERKTGSGLSTIAQRASIINYKLEITSALDDGTTIWVMEC